MVTGYLWLHGFVPIATAIHIVPRLVRRIRGGRSSFLHLKSTLCPRLEEKQHDCSAVVPVGEKKSFLAENKSNAQVKLNIL